MELTPITALNLALLFLLMIGLGTSIDIPRFKQQFTQPKPLLVGIALQFLVQPPCAILTSKLLKLPPISALALITTASCPGGTMSNIICLIFRADLDLSLAMTTASSFIALFMLPVNLSIVVSTAAVVCGTFTGLYVKYRGDQKLIDKVAKVGVLCGVVMVGWGFFDNSQSDTPFMEADTRIIGANYTQICLSVFIGVVVARLICKIDGASVMAIGTETSTQNVIIAVSILTLSLGEEEAKEAILVPLLYGTCNTTTNLVFGIVAWKVLGWSNMDKKATCREMWRSYRQLLLQVRPFDSGEGCEKEDVKMVSR